MILAEDEPEAEPRRPFDGKCAAPALRPAPGAIPARPGGAAGTPPGDGRLPVPPPAGALRRATSKRSKTDLLSPEEGEEQLGDIAAMGG